MTKQLEKLFYILVCIFLVTSTIVIADEENYPPTNLKTKIINGKPRINPIGPNDIAEIGLMCEDLENDQVYFKINWSDGNITEWLGPFNNNEWQYFTHQYLQPGNYYFGFIAKDSKEAINNSWKINPKGIEIISPTAKPELSGPSESIIGESVKLNIYVPDETKNRSIIFEWNINGDSSINSTKKRSGKNITFNKIFDESGNYIIKVRTLVRGSLFGEYTAPSEWSNNLYLTVSPLEEEKESLNIITNPYVYEKNVFQIEIKANGNPVKNAIIEFNNLFFYSNNEGFLEITAPEVDEDTVFDIVASHAEYLSNIASITIVNHEEDTKEYGYVYGYVYVKSNSYLEGADICLKKESEHTSICEQSDQNGRYYASLEIGEYAAEVNKKGYVTDVKSITILKNQAIQLDFELKKIEENNFGENDHNAALIQTTIDTAIESGHVAAKIDLESKNSDGFIEYYSDIYEINQLDKSNKDEIITFKISTENDEPAPGTFVLTFIGKDMTQKSNELIVKFDGEKLSKMSIQEFLSPNQKTEEGYVHFIDNNGNYIATWISEFSEHEISISSIYEKIDNNLTILIYVSFITLIGLFMIGPAIFFALKNAYFKKSK